MEPCTSEKWKHITQPIQNPDSTWILKILVYLPYASYKFEDQTSAAEEIMTPQSIKWFAMLKKTLPAQFGDTTWYNQLDTFLEEGWTVAKLPLIYSTDPLKHLHPQVEFRTWISSTVSQEWNSIHDGNIKNSTF